MPSYSGVWNLNAQLQAKANLQWPQGPGAPTSVTATGGDTQATISFTAPTFTGVPPGITGYRAISSPGGFTATGASSPLTVTGLTNGTEYTFSVDATNGVQYGPAGVSGSVTPAAPLGLFGNGSTTNINSLNLTTLGNGTSFGSLSSAGTATGTAASSTRAIFCGSGNVIEYATFGTTGSFSDFGDLTLARGYTAGMSSSTRGVFAGGQPSGLTNVMDYITIASAGNATDFGDTTAVTGYAGGCASSTRGVFGGGLRNSGFDFTNVMEYITIASVGNATDFGDLLFGQTWPTASSSNSTRGVFAGGFNDAGGNSSINNINYITIASTGNATDFGDLTANRSMMGSAASATRAFFAGGGATNSVSVNIIEYITIASTGNATDYGDLTTARNYGAGCSNSHGGL